MEQNEESRRSYSNGAAISAAIGGLGGAGTAGVLLDGQADKVYVRELNNSRARAMGDYMHSKWTGEGKPIGSFRDRIKQVEAKGHEGARQAVSKFWKSKKTIGKGLAGVAGGAALGALGYGGYNALTSKEASDRDSEEKSSIGKHVGVGVGSAAGALAGAAGATAGIAGKYYSDAFDVPYRMSRELGSSRLKSFRYAHDTGVKYGLKWFKEDLKRGLHNKKIGLSGVAGVAGGAALGALGYDRYKALQSKEASDQDSEEKSSLGKHVGVGAAVGSVALPAAVMGQAVVPRYLKEVKPFYRAVRNLGASRIDAARYAHEVAGKGALRYLSTRMGGRSKIVRALVGTAGVGALAGSAVGALDHRWTHKEASDQDSESKSSLGKHVGVGAAVGSVALPAAVIGTGAASRYGSAFSRDYDSFRGMGFSRWNAASSAHTTAAAHTTQAFKRYSGGFKGLTRKGAILAGVGGTLGAVHGGIKELLEQRSRQKNASVQYDLGSSDDTYKAAGFAGNYAAAALGGYALNRNRDKIASDDQPTQSTINRRAVINGMLGGALGAGSTMATTKGIENLVPMEYRQVVGLGSHRNRMAMGAYGAGLGAASAYGLTQLMQGPGIDAEPDTRTWAKARTGAKIGAGIGGALSLVPSAFIPGNKALIMPAHALTGAASGSLIGGGLGAAYGALTNKEASYNFDYNYNEMLKEAANDRSRARAAARSPLAEQAKVYNATQAAARQQRIHRGQEGVFGLAGDEYVKANYTQAAEAAEKARRMSGEATTEAFRGYGQTQSSTVNGMRAPVPAAGRGINKWKLGLGAAAAAAGAGYLINKRNNDATKVAHFGEDNLMSLYDYAYLQKLAAEEAAAAEEASMYQNAKDRVAKGYASAKDAVGRGYEATKGHLGRNKMRYGAGAAGLAALGAGAYAYNRNKEASDMSLYDYAELYKLAAEGDPSAYEKLKGKVRSGYDYTTGKISDGYNYTKGKASDGYGYVKGKVGPAYVATRDHVVRNKGRYAAGAAGVAGVGAAVAAYNQYQNKEASYNDFYDEYEEVQLAKLAAEELYQDALDKLAFAEDLYDEADFVSKVAEDLGAGVDVAPTHAYTGSPLSAALNGAGIGMGTMAGAAAGAVLAGKLGPKLNPAFYAAHPGLIGTGASILGAGIGAAAPGALTAFVEKHRQGRAQQQAASMAMQNQ